MDAEKNTVEILIDAMRDSCINTIAEKWIYHNQVFKFKSDVPLSEIIELFAVPVREFVSNSYPSLYAAGPEFFWLLVFSGIKKTVTPSEDAIKNAINKLDAKFRCCIPYSNCEMF